MQLQEKYKNRVAVISLNVDHDEAESLPPKPLQQDVLDKLTQLKMNCQNVIAADPMEVVLDHYGVFSLPAVLVYDRNGKLRKKLDTEFRYDDDVFPLVEKLLGEPK